MDRKAYETWEEFVKDAAKAWLARAKETSNLDAVMERLNVDEDHVLEVLEYKVNDYFVDHQPENGVIWQAVDDSIGLVAKEEIPATTAGKLRHLASLLRKAQEQKDYYDVHTEEQQGELVDIAVRSIDETTKAVMDQVRKLVGEGTSVSATLAGMGVDKEPLLEAARGADTALRHFSEMLYDLKQTVETTGEKGED